ncbi:MAG: hypothetical protein ACXWX7_17915 [Candidatus Binatia bacterium]
MADVSRGTIAIKFTWSYVYAAVLFGIIGYLNFITGDDRNYSRLAEAFLQGKLFFVSMPPSTWGDSAFFDGHHFWPLGPFPAVLAAPLVWTGYFHQGILSFITSLAVFYLCFRLATNFSYSRNDACWLALAFCFGTSFVGVAAISWSAYFPHTLAVLFLFLAINEYERKRRFWTIGGLIGLAMANRPPASLNILFFVLVIWLSSDTVRIKTSQFTKLIVSFLTFAGLLALYNFARFGTPLESGYSYQINADGLPYEVWNVPGNTPGPLFGVANIPNHLWTFLFGLPSVNAVGTSALLVSPFLVYLALVRQWDLTNKLIVLNVCTVLLVVLAFRSTGFEQVGYRFSLDFLPFVFWLLMRSRIVMSGRFKGLILASTIIDLCLTAFFLATGVDRRQG